MFKMYKAEVENQLNRKTKAVRSDQGGEYYDRNNGLGRCPGSFANFWKSVILSLNTPCQGRLVRMMLLRDKTAY